MPTQGAPSHKRVPRTEAAHHLQGPLNPFGTGGGSICQRAMTLQRLTRTLNPTLTLTHSLKSCRPHADPHAKPEPTSDPDTNP
eukprot:5210035-Prymnesium_polylepis.1